MGMSLRIELFPADMDAFVDFYCGVLGFVLRRDERDSADPYVFVQRDQVSIGAAGRGALDQAARRPPLGVEVVLEVDDLAAERDRVRVAGWPVEEDLSDRPWGLRDFRVLDPAGYYLRLTSRD